MYFYVIAHLDTFGSCLLWDGGFPQLNTLGLRRYINFMKAMYATEVTFGSVATANLQYNNGK